MPEPTQRAGSKQAQLQRDLALIQDVISAQERGRKEAEVSCFPKPSPEVVHFQTRRGRVLLEDLTPAEIRECAENGALEPGDLDRWIEANEPKKGRRGGLLWSSPREQRKPVWTADGRDLFPLLDGVLRKR
jgi:hypothetical protein